MHYINHLTPFFEVLDGDTCNCYYKTLLFNINSADLGYLSILYRASVHLFTMASGSCAEPGGRPKSSGVWNHFRHDKIKDKSVCTVKTTDGLICGI